MNTEETNDASQNTNESEQAEPLKLTAYDVKRKMRDVPMLEAVITKTAKGAFMAQGVSDAGTKLTTLLGKEKAMACIAAGLAKQGWDD